MSEYLTMLKSSCTISAIHKALIRSNKHEKSATHVNMMYQSNSKIINYYNRSSINDIETIFITHKDSLSSIRLFQAEYVKSSNSNIFEVSQLLYLEYQNSMKSGTMYVYLFLSN